MGDYMNVLIACEESQRVCAAFRERGHNAFSCDVQTPSGKHPEWHILGNALKAIQGGQIMTMDRIVHEIPKWDLIIAHPPCTYLSNVATRHHSLRCTPLDAINQRTMQRIEAMQFFMEFVNADCDRICIENPVGVMNTAYRKPDCIVNPYEYCDSMDSDEYVTKATCLWLKGLDPLQRTNDFPKPDNKSMWGVHPSGKSRTWEDSHSRNAKERSKTFKGIALAMAEQWG